MLTRAVSTPAGKPIAQACCERRPGLATTLLLALSLAPLSATADSFSYFPDGPSIPKFDPLESVLTVLEIHEQRFETDGQSFIVPDANGNGTPVSLTVSLIEDTGNYQFTFGAVPVEAVAGMDATQDRFAWTTAALTNLQTMVVLNDGDVPNDCSIAIMGPSCQASFSGIPVGSEWFFFLIPNNTLTAYTEDPEAYWNGTIATGCGNENSKCAKPLFSYTPANPGSFDQMLSFIGNGETLFSF
jgi:hypothetical protein